MSEDLTPKHMRCAIASSCPSVHRLEDGMLAIVGKDIITNPKLLGRFIPAPPGMNVGQGERAILISPSLLDGFVEEKTVSLRERIKELEDALRQRELLVSNLTAIVMRLLSRLRRYEQNSTLQKQAVDFINRNNLASVLRDGTPPVSSADETEPALKAPKHE